MRILITGGLGFIGSHLAERLRHEHDVTIIDNFSNNKVDSVKGCYVFKDDIRTFRTLEFYDYVIHLAAIATISNEFNPELYDVNVRGFNNICRITCGNFLYASSAAAINKLNDYGKTKAYNEWACKYGCGFRFFNVWGERDNGVVGKLMNGNATIYGGEQTRDFIHVNDVVDCIVNNLDSKGIIEVGTGVETSIKELADLIGKPYSLQPEKEFEEKRSVCVNPLKNVKSIREYLK